MSGERESGLRICHGPTFAFPLRERKWFSVSAKGVRSMSVKQAPWVDELTMFYEAAFDLPAAAARRVLADDEHSFIEAGWKAYDSWVRLANGAANQIYASRAFGEAAGRAFETVLGLRRLNDAVAPAFFESLWSALGLPTAGSVEALHEEVRALRQEHRALGVGARSSKATKVVTPEQTYSGDSFETRREEIRPEEVRPSKKAA